MIGFRRIAPLAAGLTAVLSSVPGVAMAEGGLPQLDFANRLTTYQVLWGAVSSRSSTSWPRARRCPRSKRCWRSGRDGSPAIWKAPRMPRPVLISASRRRRTDGQSSVRSAGRDQRRAGKLQTGGRRAVRRAERAAGQATERSRRPDRRRSRCRFGARCPAWRRTPPSR